MKRGNIVTAAILAVCIAASVTGMAACTRPDRPEEKPIMLSMGTDQPGSHIFMAGASVASAINNGYPSVHVDIESSPGSPINVKNVTEGKVSMAMITGKTAYDAWNGTGSFETAAEKKLCILGACYPECSQWMAMAGSGLEYVNELKGKRISRGSQASLTAEASEAVFETLRIREDNTEISSLGLLEGANALREDRADSVHGFYTAPFESFEVLAGEKKTILLQYTDEELEMILKKKPFWCRIVIPAGAYPDQDTKTVTFGQKILLCTSTDMDEETAYGIAKAMDEKAEEYTGGHRFMALMQDKDFLCNDLPIPLHPGAERYYREKGYKN